MSKHSIPFSPELIDEEEEHIRIAERADSIVQRLIRARSVLFRAGYSSPKLVFSEGTVVSLTYGGAGGELTALLEAGAEPLGIVSAPEEDELPVIQVWQENEAARAALRGMARSLHWRRFVTKETQQ